MTFKISKPVKQESSEHLDMFRIRQPLQVSEKKDEWKELHKIIQADTKHDDINKRADMELVYEWKEFKKAKGKTYGDIARDTEKRIGVHPSFLAMAYRRHEDGAKKYINAKYLNKYEK